MAMLFHITDRGSWQSASAAGEYRMSTRGRTLEEEGFIHCSLRHQLRAVAECLYADTDDLVVLTIDSTKLSAPVKFEVPEPGSESSRTSIAFAWSCSRARRPKP